jgi:hypothetical protein
LVARGSHGNAVADTIGGMRKVVALQALVGVVISAVLNTPALLLLGGTGRTVAWAFIGLVLLFLVLSATLPRGRHGPRVMVGHRFVTGTTPLSSSGDVFDSATFLRRVRRRQRWARLQIPALALGLALGSVLGAAIGAWWAEVIGGAIGYAAITAAFAWFLIPRTLLTGFRRPPSPGAPGLHHP